MTDVTNRSMVVGVFHARSAAERALDDLRAAGFPDDQIGILTHDRRDRTGETATGSLVGEGAATGAVIGGIIGAAAALLIPGIGPVVAGGILAGVLGGAAVGGVLGALVGLGIPEEEARYYEGEFRQGRTLVTVKSEGRYAEARDILRRDGAYDIEDRGLPREKGFTGTMTESTTDDVTRVPVVEEELVARKHPEETGAVEIERNVVEEQETMNVPTSHEDVHVERVPADRPLRPGEHAFTDDEMRVPIVEEEVQVEKRPIRGTVRRESVDVRRTDEVTSTGRTWAEAMPTYRSYWQSRYGTSGGRWEDVAPYYEYGCNAWSDPRYQGRDWTTVEPELRRDWDARHPTTPWGRARQYVSDVWTNIRRAA